MSPRAHEQMTTIAGRRLKVSNLAKVLYPETGTTKAEVMHYLAEVAHVLIPQAAWRPATRKRWVNGVGTADEPGRVFFRKDLEESAPEWVPRAQIEHQDHVNTYPLANEPAVLAWFAQLAALEIHVPQWRFAPGGGQSNPDRMVLDLDPGEGAGLAACAETALLCRELLTGMDLEAVPVTSGSKGIHLYVPMDGSHTSAQVSELAHELARALESERPDLVVSDMKKSLRSGKVLVDWSQNSEAKTTICPYSLRGRPRPMVAAPRSWEEIADPDLGQLDYRQVLKRVGEGLDPMADLGWTGSTETDRLRKYRSMRDPAKTPEPVPAKPVSRGGGAGAPSFVIQEHRASRLHWDFRLEHSGVLVSWAVPKGPPLEPGVNRLAVMTEDHPLDYGSFEGTIPKGSYGAGEVVIWDAGTCEMEKWHEGKEIIVVLHGRPAGGLGGVPRRYALIHTPGMGAEKNWLVQLMKDQPVFGAETAGGAQGGSGPAPETGGLPAPMLATAGTADDLDPQDRWAFEMKWDGIRAIAAVSKGEVRMVSRNGKDLSAAYPELQELASLVGNGAVLDGEIVAPDSSGRPDFGRLQQRMKLTKKREIEAMSEKIPVHLMIFDALRLPSRAYGGADSTEDSEEWILMGKPYAERRKALLNSLEEGRHIHLPAAHTGNIDEAIDSSRELGLEGVVAKKTDSRYLSGRRSREWIKIKHTRQQEVVVIGWRRGNGNRAGTFGSLLLAVHEHGKLHYAGRVGTGFSARDLEEAAAKLRRMTRKTAPVSDVPAADRRDAIWVSPKLVGEVQYGEPTGAGKLRHPVWRGWRPDKTAAEVRWEIPPKNMRTH